MMLVAFSVTISALPSRLNLIVAGSVPAPLRRRSEVLLVPFLVPTSDSQAVIQYHKHHNVPTADRSYLISPTS